MGVIVYFIPYLYLFAAMIKLQRDPAGPEVIRVPGGSAVAKLVATIGFVTTTLTIVLSLIPQPDEPNKPLALVKIIGGTGALVLVGVWLYLSGKRRAAKAPLQK
jgi:amino acid transporter